MTEKKIMWKITDFHGMRDGIVLAYFHADQVYKAKDALSFSAIQMPNKVTVVLRYHTLSNLF